jgi:DNA-binding NtrC family response regulator
MFREDLFYRLNVVTIHIPPLRERREEIPVFLDFFLRKYSEFYGKTPAPFSDYAVGRMMEYSWPGNIRELENLVKRYTIVGNEPQIIRELSTHKPIMRSEGSTNAPIWGIKQTEAQPSLSAGSTMPPVSAMPGGMAANAMPAGNGNGNGHSVATMTEMEMPSLLEIGRRAAMQAEREAIERVLAQTRWNRRQAAKILKISYKALLNKLKIMEEQNQIQAKQHSA